MSQPQYDPVYLHARREAAVVMLMFAAALLWSVGNYYLVGLVDGGFSAALPVAAHAQPSLLDDPRFAAPEVSTVLGMPLWVFTGILLPWLAIDVAVFWFCYYYMADDDLGLSPEEADAPTTTT